MGLKAVKKKKATKPLRRYQRIYIRRSLWTKERGPLRQAQGPGFTCGTVSEFVELAVKLKSFNFPLGAKSKGSNGVVAVGLPHRNYSVFKQTPSNQLEVKVVEDRNPG